MSKLEQLIDGYEYQARRLRYLMEHGTHDVYLDGDRQMTDYEIDRYLRGQLNSLLNVIADLKEMV